MKSQKRNHQASSLAPLLLFVIFTTCILSVLLTGADTYQKLSLRDQNNFQHRTVAQYLTTRIRQSDVTDMVFVGSFSEDIETTIGTTAIASPPTGDTLFLRESLEGRVYYTRIYCHDGYMRELFAPDGLEFSPTAGQGILPVADLHFAIQDDLLSIRITYIDGASETLSLHLRSSEEVPS
ncbi:MAG: DUF4860 domain-containing protein [Lachnospiraceae bacterium]|nr:DUF4860 domain-containing protein [Lachnospiraceae bacterium]